MKYVGDNFEMLVAVLADFVTNIPCLQALASGINIQKMSLISKFCHQHPKIVTNIKSPTSTCHQHLCSHIIMMKVFTRFLNYLHICLFNVKSQDPIRTFHQLYRSFPDWTYQSFWHQMDHCTAVLLEILKSVLVMHSNLMHQAWKHDYFETTFIEI